MYVVIFILNEAPSVSYDNKVIFLLLLIILCFDNPIRIKFVSSLLTLVFKSVESRI